ncbi:MAG: PPOX class F420-dependent oxidoreductase [Solirubrobacteraceae bacterium]
MAAAMTAGEVRAFLCTGTRTGKLATTMRDGAPHVMPIWFVLDGDEIVFMTGADTVKGRALRRDPRASLVVDDEVAPYAFVHVRGSVTISEDLAELRRFGTLLGARYMGAELAEDFGRRNAVAGELLIRLAPGRVIAQRAVAD